MDAAAAKPILTLLNPNTPTCRNRPCERCAAGWGVLPDGEYCQCDYGRTLGEAWHRRRQEEQDGWLADVRGVARLPQKYRHAKLGDFAPSLAKQAQEAVQVSAGRGLFVWGPVGTGKTHLAAALLNGELDAGRPGYWLIVPQWLESMRRAYGSEDGPAPLMERATDTRLLVLDDLGVEKPTEWVQEQLYCLVNARYLDGRATIVTSNRSLAELEPRIGDRTCSRIAEMCESLHLGGKDRRIKR